MKDNEPAYVCTFTPYQMSVICRALDLYSRIGMGQLESIADSHIGNMNVDVPTLRERLRELEPMITGLSSGYWSIMSDKIGPEFKIAWDIQQVLRYVKAWNENPTGGMTVDFDPPLKCSNHPLCSVAKLADLSAETKKNNE